MFSVFKDESGEYRWHLTAENGEIVAQSEGYSREADAVRGAYDAVAAFADSLEPRITNEVEETKE